MFFGTTFLGAISKKPYYVLIMAIYPGFENMYKKICLGPLGVPFFLKSQVYHFAPEMGQSGTLEMFLKKGGAQGPNSSNTRNKTLTHQKSSGKGYTTNF